MQASGGACETGGCQSRQQFHVLDAAFGEDSQEALIYLTKLSIDPTAARLVGEYGSAEFMRHNKGLLLEERGLDLLNEIKNLD